MTGGQAEAQRGRAHPSFPTKQRKSLESVPFLVWKYHHPMSLDTLDFFFFFGAKIEPRGA